jgi:hypothetical protein
LIGDKSHLIDWLAGRTTGDHYAHTLPQIALNGSFSQDSSQRFCLRIPSSSF